MAYALSLFCWHWISLASWVVSSVMFFIWLQGMTLSYVISNYIFELDSYGHVSVIYNQKLPLKCSIKKLFSKISLNSQENTCARVSFLIKLQLQLYWKRDSGTGVFLWILRNFKEHLLYRTPLGDCFCLCIDISHKRYKNFLRTKKSVGLDFPLLIPFCF